MPSAAQPAPRMPITDANRKPERLPKVRINNEAGMVVPITATNCTASGRLANAGFSARWPPIIAAEVTISELTDSSIACAKTSCAMLRFKGWPIERWV